MWGQFWWRYHRGPSGVLSKSRASRILWVGFLHWGSSSWSSAGDLEQKGQEREGQAADLEEAAMGQQWGWVVPRCGGWGQGIAAEGGNPGSLEEAEIEGLSGGILPRYRAIVILKPGAICWPLPRIKVHLLSREGWTNSSWKPFISHRWAEHRDGECQVRQNQARFKSSHWNLECLWWPRG